MKRNKTMLNQNFLRSFIVLSFSFFMFSCNKELENKIDLGKDVAPVTVKGKSYRVAYIVIDGAVGSTVGSQATDFNSMPYLGKMTENGLFSWNSISSDYTSDISYYADLLTGVNVNKHQVTSTNLTTAKLDQYPLIFDRLKTNLDIRTSVISGNPDVKLLTEKSNIDNRKYISTDQEALTEAVKELKEENTGVTLVTLKEVDDTGKSSGYGPNSTAYISALKSADDKIKTMVETIKSRPNYNSEKWLIVVASNRGGDYTIDPNLQDNSLYSVPKRNNFVLFYHNQFSYKIIQKVDMSDPTYDGSAIRYTGSATTAAIQAAQAAKYNIGSTAADGEYTIQFRVKIHALGTNNPTFFSKMDHTGNSTNGWSFIYNGQLGWRFKVFGKQVIDPKAFALDQWYTLTAKIYNENGKRRAKIFTNGVAIADDDITGSQGTSTQPLKLGYGTAFGSNASHSITDVRFFNMALPDDYIAKNYCSTAIYNDSPYWSKLIGYWPAIDGSGQTIKDYSNSKTNFELTGSVAWNSFSERSGSVCPTAPQNLDLSTIRTIDIPMMIYNWVGVLGTERFNLDSKIWAPSFSEN